MSLFEIVCIATMTAGAVLIIGAVGYCFISKVIEKCKSKRQIEDEISQYWKAIYTVAEKANKKALQKK